MHYANYQLKHNKQAIDSNTPKKLSISTWKQPAIQYSPRKQRKSHQLGHTKQFFITNIITSESLDTIIYYGRYNGKFRDHTPFANPWNA